MGQGIQANPDLTGMGDHIRIIEHQEIHLDRNALSDEEAIRLNDRFKDQVAVTWPSPLTGQRWRLQSQGWVGFIPLGMGRGIVLEPKVPLQNLFRMLEYAFGLRGFQVLSGTFECDSIPDFFERLADLLSRKILERARAGFYRAFLSRSELRSFVRGRLDIPALLAAPGALVLPCEFEEQTLDVPENQILAWTLHRILQSGVCTSKSLPKVRMADKILRGVVSLKPFAGRDCLGRDYNRLNADYRILHLLCRFFLDCLGPSPGDGGREMLPFLIDMASLFETFVAKWLEENMGPRLYLRAQESRTLGGASHLRLVPDLILYDRATRKPCCVLDTKYKAKGSVSGPDYYQVIAYADALHCLHSVLVYPMHLERAFDAQPGRIRVRSAVFDLGRDLEQSGNELLKSIYDEIDGLQDLG